MMRRFFRHLIVPFLLCISACQQQGDHFGAHPVTYDQLADWQTDDHAQALQTFLASCPNLMLKPRPKTSGSDLKISARTWQNLCYDGAAIPPSDPMLARQFFEQHFTPYRIANNNKENGLFTGYYVPTLYGSQKKTASFQYPLYSPPADLASHKPYYTHAEINRGALKNRGLELLWVDDPVMIFFLQIQGSGRVRLDDGTSMLVGYAGQNGRGYVSLGKIMGDEGVLPKDNINFYTIRQWLYDHPQQAVEMMERNPSFVFFKRLDQQGAVGAVGSVLNPRRSIAVDNRYIPYGLPLFMESDMPALPGKQPERFNHLVIAQDTGGAIKGPVRADIFFGEGGEAEYLAGYMKGHGVYSLLVPNDMVKQLQ